MQGFFDTPIEFLKGVGPAKAELLKKELAIATFGDLIQHYPFRYEDRTQFHRISAIGDAQGYVQVKGQIRHVEMAGSGRKKRLVAQLHDQSGQMELVWFTSSAWIAKRLQTGIEYVVYGKPNRFKGKYSLAHPEIEPLSETKEAPAYLHPVYPSTEKLRVRFLDSKGIANLQKQILKDAQRHIYETLPLALKERYRLISKKDALIKIHFPKDDNDLNRALFRLKFEELFYLQLRLIKQKLRRIEKAKGQAFRSTALLKEFYQHHLPFKLTAAQKRVIREVFEDLKSGKQMNRLLQGDVGSGKTIVSFICMLVAIGGGSQVAMMAPTEILADQHYSALLPFARALNLQIDLLKGSSKAADRKRIHEGLETGELHILVGTHALIEDHVRFKNLGLAVVDEQHRFGVAQRARLWAKNPQVFPHILVMTATPIPRTLAMTLYGDLDTSVIDELPEGRKEIMTAHHYEKSRLEVFGFIRKQIALGRQAYIVYPLIEESEKLDLKHLTDGYEAIRRAFPEYQVGILHGKMKTADKDVEMRRFVGNQSKIMVATTVIEVGVNVPNATVMIIENAERFGLAQLHQLRGRVGRGADQSYCILMTDYKMTRESRQRIETMVRTNDGFEIAEMDLKLRGPGDLMGTQQSGLLDLLVADLRKDSKVLEIARLAAQELLAHDPALQLPEHHMVKMQVEKSKKSSLNWSRIS
jgi:ATP-dependent DNA helicase RecG